MVEHGGSALSTVFRYFTCLVDSDAFSLLVFVLKLLNLLSHMTKINSKSSPENETNKILPPLLLRYTATLDLHCGLHLEWLLRTEAASGDLAPLGPSS